MSGDSVNIPDNIRQKFPHLQPLKRPPSLMTMNGFGVGMYGKRDFDQETQTYVKTRCFCAVFIPLFALDAYRVADAGSRSWYFLGKESLSSFARSWNVALGCALLFAGLAFGWNLHTSSSEYKARHELERAATLMNSNQPLKAAAIYRQQLDGPAGTQARQGLKNSLEACLQSDQPQTVRGGFRLLAGLSRGADQPGAFVPDAFNRGLALVAKFRKTDPESALDLLEQVTALDTTNAAASSLHIDLLKSIVAAAPDKTNRVIELAVAYENADQVEESWKLLRPYQHGLGATEGARILGQELLQERKYSEAYELLSPYVRARLDNLHAIEASYTNAVAAASKRAIDDLNAGRADRNFYFNYKTASKERQQEMVDNFIEQHMKSDPGIQRVLRELKDANRIVTVALDLGIVQLNRAQELADAAARKTELENAEKTFLAIRGLAGNSDEYRLFLGQVYYWLGKSNEGKQLFDELLASRNRAYGTLMALSSTLRAVGETADARALAEEAYQSARSDQDKFSAARLRALTAKDDDDQIAWLEKSDPQSASTQIVLNSARGKKALAQNNKTAAASYLRQAIRGYENQPKSPAMLNNCGLCWFDLYQATGNPEDNRRGMALLEEAVAMDPSDSILLHNTMFFLISRAVADSTEDSINTEVLGEHAGIQLLAHLYQNDTERAKVYGRLREDEAMKKGLAYLDKALLLAPKNVDLYGAALAIYSAFRDPAELLKLQQRFRVAAPDLAEIRQQTLKIYSGAQDKEQLDKLQTRVRQLENMAQNAVVRSSPLTLEHVNVSLVEAWENLWVYGGQTDSRKLLQTALETYRHRRSTASRQALQSAYFFEANEELMQQSPDYAALVNQTHRTVSPQYLISFVLDRGGPLASQALKNQHLSQALALEKESIQNFPAWASADEWALLHNTSPDTASQVAQRLGAGKAIKLASDLQFQFNPWSVTAVLEQYWTCKMTGNEAEGLALYRKALQEGVPLPPM